MPGLRRTVSHCTTALVASTAVFLSHLPLRPVLAADQPDLSFGPDTTPRAVFADTLVGMAMMSIAGTANPRDDQWTRARILLDNALEQNPNDPELWQIRREMAKRLNEPEVAGQALLRYCALVPEDDAAQLDLILEHAQTKQTVDDRLAQVERFLEGAGTERFSAPLRSRLATYAAAQLRETADQARYIKRLKQALELDPSNADAAKLFLEWMVNRKASPTEQGVAMMAIVKAAPVDSQMRWSLANLLLSVGAYSHAAEQFSSSAAVATGREDIPDAVTHYTPWALSLLAAGKFDEATNLMDELEQGFIHAAKQQEEKRAKDAKDREEKEKSEPDTPDASTPAETAATPEDERIEPRLPLDLEFCNYAIRDRNNQKDRAEGSYNRLRTILSEGAQKGDVVHLAGLAWISVLANRDLDTVEATLARVPESAQDQTRRVRGWLELRSGNTARARELLTPLASSDAFAAYGMALTVPVETQRADRVKLLQQTIHAFPKSLAAALAARDMATLGERPAPVASAIPLVKAMDGWSSSLRSPNFFKYPWTSLSVTVDPDFYGYIEPIYATVTLRNMTDLPLAMGEGGAVSSQLIIVAAPHRAGEALKELPPVVVNMRRRLRIEPRQSIVAKVRIDRSGLSSVLEGSPTETISFNLTSMLDPTPSPRGGMVPGPLGAVTTTPMILRSGMPLTNPNVDTWVRWIGPSGDPVDRLRGLAILSLTATRLGDSDQAKAASKRMADALLNAYEGLDDVGKAWTLSYLPTDPDGVSFFKPIHESAQRSTSRLVQLVYLSLHVQQADSPVLTAAMRSADRNVSEFARAQAAAILAAEQEADKRRDATGR